jgi:hypothetical protein
MSICPGQNTRLWKPEDVFEVTCTRCGGSVEFFKDDGTRRCRGCGLRMQNPRLSLGCAQWCEHAKACLGYDPAEAKARNGTEESMLQKLIEEVRREFTSDEARVAHALGVLEHAEDILLAEEGCVPQVALAAAVLHELGGPDNACDGENDPARRILDELGFHHEAVDRVCALVSALGNDGEDSPEFRVVHDAERLAHLREGLEGGGVPARGELHREFHTQMARDLARMMLERSREGPRT